MTDLTGAWGHDTVLGTGWFLWTAGESGASAVVKGIVAVRMMSSIVSICLLLLLLLNLPSGESSFSTSSQSTLRLEGDVQTEVPPNFEKNWREFSPLQAFESICIPRGSGMQDKQTSEGPKTHTQHEEPLVCCLLSKGAGFCAVAGLTRVEGC